MDSNQNNMQFKQHFASTQGRPLASGQALSLPKRTASTASNRSLVSGDTASFLLEGGKSQSSKRAGGATHL